MNYAVIMAGGIGSRFWPRSRKRKPKQVLNIFGTNTLLQETVYRISDTIPFENILVVTTPELLDHVSQQLPDVLAENIIVEPVGRNTAPCIGLAAKILSQRDPDSAMVVLPADHLISEKDRFNACIKQAFETAKSEDALVTLGINPTQPETGYGYIQYDPQNKKPSGSYDVKTFAEKPNIETARRFLASGDFLWNSGMFIWSNKRILKEIELALPELYAALMQIDSLEKGYQDPKFAEIYRGLRAISVDYGIMEHAKNVAVVKGDFSWSDIGNWAEVYRLSPKDSSGNVNLNGHILVDTSNCMIDSGSQLVATVGVKDLIVINTGDALLICHRDSAQDVRRVVEIMERKNMDDYM
ncbi:NTP transferase domain-containing protein [bacterium]|nr:NTP transferase domain-containing protein [bacterium]MBU1651141.1 NTP transferase domain-containing protein [bacterium]